MPTKRIKMREIKRILALHFVDKLSNRGIARWVGISRASVARLLERAKRAQLMWPLPEDITDAKLEAMLYPPTTGDASVARLVPNWVEVRRELAQHRSLTLHQVWTEYIEEHPTGYQYSRFAELYRNWRSTQVDPVMRLTHKAGERLFVDYSGKKPTITDPDGEVREVELFVAVLGASGYLYAEATQSQKVADFCGSIRRTFEFFGGVPKVLVPDNLKSAVIKFRTDDTPILNESFHDLAEHYNVQVFPARPRKPRDKAKAEGGVLLLQRKVLGALRNVTFHSLAELNEAILEQVQELNQTPFQKHNTTRARLFEEMDQPMLRPFPQEPYEFAVWIHNRKVSFHYHIQMDRHHYSVPYTYLNQQVSARVTAKTVEIFHGETRIASHLRESAKQKYTTVEQHMPKNHQDDESWPPSRLVNWAKQIGPSTTALIEEIFARAFVPAQVFRRCMGILRLGREFGNSVLEQACEHALNQDRLTTAAVKKLAKRIADESQQSPSPIEHKNIRGADYYSSN